MVWQPGRDYCLKWLDQLNVRQYPISWVYLEQQSLLYIPMPKNASTQVLESLYALEHGVSFDSSSDALRWAGNVHFYYSHRFPAMPASRLLELGAQRILVVVRDPIERLVSAYRNRVVDGKCLEQKRLRTGLLGLNMTPDLDTVLNNLSRYRLASPVLRQHTEPQQLYLKNLWPQVTDVYPIEQLGALHEQLLGIAPTKEKVNASSKDEASAAPSRAALLKALDYCANDYCLLNEYYSPPS